MIAGLVVALIAPAAAQATEPPEFWGIQQEVPPTQVHSTLSGAQSGSHEYSAGTGYGTVKCATATTTATLETGEATAITANPTYGSCTSGALSVHTRLNGCDYRYDVEEELSADKFKGSTDVVCTGGEEIEVEITKSGGGFKCLSTFGSQEGLGPVYFENQTGVPQDVLIEAKITNLKNRTSGGAPNCGVVNGEHTAGTYTGKTTLIAKNKASTQIDARLDGGETPKLTTLETFEGPQFVHTIIEGTQIGTNLLVPSVGSGSVKCSTASLSGTWETGKSTSLTVTPAYSGCTAYGESLTTHARTNGCDYKFNLGEQLTADKFAASVDISCPKTEELEFEVTKSGGGLKCLISIPSQTAVGAANFENQTGSSPKSMVLIWELSGLKTRTAGGEANCGVANGEHKDGTYVGETTIQGFNTSEVGIDVEVSGEESPGGEVTNTLGETASEISGVSGNTTFTTSLGTFNCTTAYLYLNVKVPGKYSGTGKVFGSGGGHEEKPCRFVPSNIPVNFTSVVAELSVNGNGTGNVDLEFQFEFGGSKCMWVNSPESSPNITYTETTDEITVATNLIGSGSAPCFSAGVVSGNFTILDEYAEPVSIH